MRSIDLLSCCGHGLGRNGPRTCSWTPCRSCQISSAVVGSRLPKRQAEIAEGSGKKMLKSARFPGLSSPKSCRKVAFLLENWPESWLQRVIPYQKHLKKTATAALKRMRTYGLPCFVKLVTDMSRSLFQHDGASAHRSKKPKTGVVRTCLLSGWKSSCRGTAQSYHPSKSCEAKGRISLTKRG